MTKLSQEELQQIKDLQVRYNKTIFELGAAQAQLMALEEQIEKITAEKKNLIADIKSIEEKENNLVKELQEKYGQGNINIETGEITPIQ